MSDGSSDFAYDILEFSSASIIISLVYPIEGNDDALLKDDRGEVNLN